MKFRAIHIPAVYDFDFGYAHLRGAIENGQQPVNLEEYIEVAAPLHMTRISLYQCRIVEHKEIL